MKRRRKDVTLLDEHRRTVAGSQHRHRVPDPGNPRRADEDHLERRPGQRRRRRENGRVDLPAIGVAFNRNIERMERGLRRIQHRVGQQDAAGAGAEGRLTANEEVQRPKEAATLQVFKKRSRFAARDNQPVERLELMWLPNQHSVSAKLPKHGRMNIVSALQGQHADSGRRESHTLMLAAQEEVCTGGDCEGTLPAACLHQVLLFDRGGGQTLHRAGYRLARLSDDRRIVEVSGRQHDGARA